MSDNTTILLDIYERLGKIETKLEHLENMETEVADLRQFKSKVGAYLWIGSTIATGALYLLIEGAKFGLGKLFHQ